jgi:hypothetical protein
LCFIWSPFPLMMSLSSRTSSATALKMPAIRHALSKLRLNKKTAAQIVNWRIRRLLCFLEARRCAMPNPQMIFMQIL